MCVEETRQNFLKYDINDVFTIVRLNPNNSLTTIGNLFDKYVVITIKEVVASNEFFVTRVKQTDHHWIGET